MSTRYDIVCDIVDKKRIDKLRREIERSRRKGGIKGRELRKIAGALGRSLGKRGKEPTWVSEQFPTRPLSIPGHPGDLNRNTAGAILDQLEQDLDEIEEKMDDE
jgi:hypothetical protein